VVVDQLLPSALDPTLPGGLGRLAREGRVFRDAALAHAATETCPGHAALVTGRHPGAAGIPGNQFRDAATGQVVWCADDPAPDARVLGGMRGRSPRRLRASALGDWMKAAWSGSRVFAVSGKDRSAVMLGGRAADGAFWLDVEEALGWTTSRYYREELPDWLREFAGDGALRLSEVPERWEHEDGSVPNGARRDDDPAESPLFGRTSGHALRGASARETLQRLSFSPFLDRVTLEVARRLATKQELGRDATPDLLALSLSATDLVGHLYGPESQEARDARRRLDGWLGEFLDSLEASSGGELLVVLTSDHGVLPLPESLEETGLAECPVAGGRVDLGAILAGLERELEARLGGGADPVGPWVVPAGLEVVVNRPLAASRGVAPERVAEIARRFLEAQPGVARAWTAADRAAGHGPRPFATLYRHSFDPERSGDVAIQPERGCLLSTYLHGTSHGSPHAYDREIPLVFFGAGVEPGGVRGAAGVVDVAPTVAVRLGIRAPDGLDGRVLALRGTP
jgi:hypothetical protein